MSESHLKHDALKVSELIDEYHSGRLVIPEFQREYVWKRSRAPKLLDSLYKGYPISSLLVWSSDEEITARRRNPRPSRNAVNWLIDGQQRVITLAKIKDGTDSGINVVFNPKTEQFALPNAATRKDPNWVPLSELWDDVSFRQHRKYFGDSRTDLLHEDRFEKVRQILDYQVPIVNMFNYSFPDAVDAFKRINTLGVKLKKEDIESAEVAAKHSTFIRDEVAPFLKDIHNKGYSRVNVMHLFRVCAFLAQPDGRNRTPLHALSKKEVLAAWKRTEKATDEAIGLIRSEFGLVNMDILWSGALLVPVIALVATQSPRDRNNEAIAGWVALASIAHRYSGSSETALDQDLRACSKDNPVRALLNNLKSTRASLKATANDFRSSFLDRGSLLAMYIACKHKGIRDFFSGGPVILQPNVDRHHILPKGQFPEKRKKSSDTIANIAFISGPTNKSVSNTGPEIYLQQIPTRVLRSQCIPEEPRLWRIDKAEEFWAARQKLLAEAFNDYLKSVLPKNRRIG